MTRDAITQHSPAWLALLAQAHARAQASAALLDCQVTMTSMAATQTRAGGGEWKKLVRKLEKLSTD